MPEAAETAALAKDIELVAQTGARTHFGQLSCARSVDMIRRAKARGLPITADCAMHQLFLTDHDVGNFDSNKLTLPPLRSQYDRDALREGIVDGSIDCICSDHQPHEVDAKLRPFPSAEPGISALDTLLALAFLLRERYAKFGKGIVGKTFMLGSYGSGSTMIIVSGRIAPGAPEVIEAWDLDSVLTSARPSGFDNYETWLSAPHSNERLKELFAETEIPGQSFYLGGIRDDGYRQYAFKNG